ncbi:MAG: DUF983 domain-containing protein [Candidatus Polarisedimenticolia bacterium]
MKRIRAVLRQRCPSCLEGRVFRGLFAMRDVCPECAWRFEREPGYFVGAMYVSYGLALPILAGLVLLVHAFRPAWSEYAAMGAALPVFLPLVPILFRASRLIWMHLDVAVDPGRRSGAG